MQPFRPPPWRDRTVWALLLCGTAIALALASIAVSFRWPVQWGAVAEWVGGIGSILAAVVAVGIAVHGNNRQDAREEAERQSAAERARRRASRVQIERHRIGGSSSQDEEVQLLLQNKGPTDLYELEWFTPLLVYFNEDNAIEHVEYARGTTISDHRNRLETSLPETLTPGKNRRIYVPCTGSREDLAGREAVVVELVTYVDADGYRIGRVYLPNTNPNSRRVAVPQWAVVDDDYPASSTGLTRELLDRLGSP